MPLAIPQTAFGIPLAIYILAMLFFFGRVIFDQKWLSAVGQKTAFGGLVIHAIVLFKHLYQQSYPFVTGKPEFLQLISFGLILSYILLCYRPRFRLTGVLFVPFALVFFIASLGPVAEKPLTGWVIQNHWAFLHLIFIFLSMVALMLSLLMGFLFLLSEQRIKNKITGGIWDRFPPLVTLEQVHYRALVTGFLLFTAGILFGLAWSKSVQGYYFQAGLKEILSLVAWVFFALFFKFRVPRGWVGRRGVLISIAGFIILVFLLSWV